MTERSTGAEGIHAATSAAAVAVACMHASVSVCYRPRKSITSGAAAKLSVSVVACRFAGRVAALADGARKAGLDF